MLKGILPPKDMGRYDGIHRNILEYLIGSHRENVPSDIPKFVEIMGHM